MLALSAVIERYRLISQDSSRFDTHVENEKKMILQQILAELVKDAPLPFFRQIKHEHEREITKQSQQYAYYLLLCFGVLEDLANSYFMGSALFLLLLPSISTAALFIASMTYASIEGFLFYAFDSYELRKAMGIAEVKTSLGELIFLCEEELKLATDLNVHLALISTLRMSDERYEVYLKFLSLVNRDLMFKSNLISGQCETMFHKILRRTVMLFGAISSLAGSYFMVTTLMTLFCFSMINTPVGLGLIVLTMALGLAFHYCVGSTSLTRMVNPHYEKFHTLKEELSSFHQTYPQNGEVLLRQRQEYRANFSSCPSRLASNSLFKRGDAVNVSDFEPVVQSQVKANRQI